MFALGFWRRVRGGVGYYFNAASASELAKRLVKCTQHHPLRNGKGQEQTFPETSEGEREEQKKRAKRKKAKEKS